MKKKVKVFEELRQSLTSALAHEMGEPVDLRVMEVPSRPKSLKPAEIRDIRRRLHASQLRFAHFLNVSPKAVQSWEQGSRKPRSAALRLLSIAKKDKGALGISSMSLANKRTRNVRPSRRSITGRFPARVSLDRFRICEIAARFPADRQRVTEGAARAHPSVNNCELEMWHEEYA